MRAALVAIRLWWLMILRMADERLAGKDHGSLRDRPDAARELEMSEIIKEVLVKDPESAQIGDVLRGKVKLLDIIDQLFDAAHDGISAAAGVIAVESIEDHRAVLFVVLEITLHHGELIQVSQQCQILSVHTVLFRRARRGTAEYGNTALPSPPQHLTG